MDDQFPDQPEQLTTTLLEKAADSTSEGISISSMLDEDRPLVYVNKGFEHMTGYTWEEAVGRNCRFLQGEDTDEKTVAELRSAIRSGSACTVELLNYRKDGSKFWNRLSITPIRNEDGDITHYVGIQSDITILRQTRARLEEANRNLEAFRHRLTGELEQARLAQEFLLPAQLPKCENIKFASKFVPMEEVGGDLYDVIELDEGVYGILIADVTGHGIPAALLTFMTSTTFKNSAPGVYSTAETLSETNEKLFAKMPDDAFVTMFYAIYNANTQMLTFTQAGHPPGFILRTSTNEIIPLQTGDTLVGVFSNDEISFKEKTIELQHGDRMILYTDAINETLERSDANGEEAPFRKFLSQHLEVDLNDLFAAIYDHGLDVSKLETYDDDFTLVGFEVLGNHTE